ncbi:hypothetical protein LTR86_009518 [Recurvomyces mirabilis]|nr:hypothetical protein LTR86_009518 [Recurvomyces mirabilis]
MTPEARRFYTAFYQWTVLLAGPKSAASGRSCKHATTTTTRRTIHNTTRRREGQSVQWSGPRIPKSPKRETIRRVEGEHASLDFLRPSADPLPKTAGTQSQGQHGGQPYRLGGPQPVQPQQQPSSSSPIPHLSSRNTPTSSLLHSPVQTLDATPLHTIQLWAVAIRYRSPGSNNLIVEICLPLDRANALEGKYGEGLERLGRETGAKLEMGGMTWLRTPRKGVKGSRVRGLVVSGGVEACGKVCAVVEEVRRAAGFTDMVEDRAGDGVEGRRVRTVAGREPKTRTRTRVEDDEQQQQQQRRPSSTPSPITTIGSRQLFNPLTAPILTPEDKPFASFHLWDRVVRYRSSSSTSNNNNNIGNHNPNITIEACLPPTPHNVDLAALSRDTGAQIEMGKLMEGDGPRGPGRGRRRSVLISGRVEHCDGAWELLTGAGGLHQGKGEVAVGLPVPRIRGFGRGTDGGFGMVAGETGGEGGGLPLGQRRGSEAAGGFGLAWVVRMHHQSRRQQEGSGGRAEGVGDDEGGSSGVALEQQQQQRRKATDRTDGGGGEATAVIWKKKSQQQQQQQKPIKGTEHANEQQQQQRPTERTERADAEPSAPIATLEGGWVGMESVLRRLRSRWTAEGGLAGVRGEVARVEGVSAAGGEVDGVEVSTAEEGYWEAAASVAPPRSMDDDGVEVWDSSSIPSEMSSGESTSSPTPAVLPRDTASSSPAASSSKNTVSSPSSQSGALKTEKPSTSTVEHGQGTVKAPSKHDWVVVAESAESITLDITIWRDRLDLLYAMRGPKLEGLMTGKFEGVQISVLDTPTPGSVTTGAPHDVGAEQVRAVVRITGPPLTARKARDAVWLVQGERGFAYHKALLETEAVAGEEDRKVARLAAVLKWKRSVRSREAHPVSTMPLLGYAVRALWEDELGGTLEMVVAERTVPGSGDVEAELTRGVEEAVKIEVSQMWEKDGEAVRSVVVEGSWEGIARVISKARGWAGEKWEAVTAGKSTTRPGNMEATEATPTHSPVDAAKNVEVPVIKHGGSSVIPDTRNPRHPALEESELRLLGLERGAVAVSAVVRGARSFSTLTRARSYATQASAPRQDDSSSTAAMSPTKPAKPVSHDEHEHNNIEIVVLPLHVRPHLVGKNGETRARIISQSGIKDLRIASSPRGLEHTHVYITDDDPRARRKAEALVQEVYQWAVKMDPHLTYLWFWRSKVSSGHDVSASAFEQPKARFVAVLRLAAQDRKRRARIKRFVLGGAEGYRLQRTAIRSFTEIQSFWGRHGGFRVSGYEMRDVERAVLLLRMQIRQMPDADEREREGGEVTETFVERAVADGEAEFVKVEGSEWGSEMSGEQASRSGSVRDGEDRAVQSGAGSAGVRQHAGEQEVSSEEFVDSLYDSQVVLVPHAELQMQKDVDDFLLRDERAALKLISQQTNCQIYKRQRPNAGVWVMRGRKDDVERAKILLQKRLDVAREISGIAKLKIPRLLLELSSRVVDDDERTRRRNAELGNDVRAISRPLTQSVVLITTRMPEPTPGETSGQKFADCRGVTVSSFTTVTIQPVPVVSFNLKLPSRTWDAVERSGRLCIHVMAATPEAAAITHVFTQKHDLPSYPFAELVHNGINVAVPSDDDISPPRIKSKTGAVLARVECRVLMVKSVFIGDHVVVFAEVHSVALPGEARDASRAEMLERLEEATGLAYAKRGFRGMGEVIETSPQWEKPAAHEVEMVDGVERPAKADTAASIHAAVTESVHTADSGTPAHDAEADSSTTSKRRSAAVADEEDEYDFGFLRDRDAGKDLERSVSEILEVGSKSDRPHGTSR